MMRGGGSSIFAARWRHQDCVIPVHDAGQSILCFHECGTSQVNKYERGRQVGNYSEPGSLTFIPCDGTEWEILGECQVLHVYLDQSLIVDCALDISSSRLEINPFFSISDKWLQGYFRMLLAECEMYGGEVDSLFLSQSRVALVQHLLRWHSSVHALPRSQSGLSDSIPPVRLKAVLDYIQSNIDQPVTLKDLADVACFSEYHFARCFKEAIGMTPYRFVLNKRLAAAADQLSTGRLPIKVVAQSVGFPNSRHFSASFKAWSGKMPNEYRKAHL